jgi:hypothetical protein
MTLEEILAQLEQLDSITDTDALEALEQSIVALYQELRGQDDLSDDDLSALEELAQARRSVQTRLATIAQEAADRDANLADLDAEMLGDDGDGEGDDADADGGDGDDADAGDGDEGGDGDDAGGDEPGDGDDADAGDAEGADERELVTASAVPSRATRQRLAQIGQRQPRRQREPVGLGTDIVTAAVGVPEHFSAGQRITSADDFGRAMQYQNENVGQYHGPAGTFQKYPVLTVRRDFATELTIRDRHSPEQVGQIHDLAIARHLAAIDQQVASMGTDVVLAAGGPCVAAEPDYRVDFVGGNTRPFSTAFPTVRYPRGRVSFYPPLCFDGADADSTYAEIGRAITQAQDTAGYDASPTPPETTPKGCVRIDCPETTGCGLEILIKCLTIGNWVDRTFPEYVRAWQQLIDVYYARAYEQRHIAQVVAGSTILTDTGNVFGAALSLSSAILRVIEHNNGARRAPNRTWRLIIPQWGIALLKIDLMRYLNATSNGLAGLNITDAQVVSLLRSLGVNVSTYIDESGPTTQGDDQLLALLTTGAIPELPESMRAFLFPEGQWIRGTGGELTTGVIRDTALIQVNDFQTFFEEWTAMCQRGCTGDSYIIDAALCPSGVAGGTVVLDCFGES